MKKQFKTRHLILRVIEENWPVSVSGVCDKIDSSFPEGVTLQRIKYHFDKLKDEGRIKTKKIGGSLVAWPFEIEKLRVIHELLRVE